MASWRTTRFRVNLVMEMRGNDLMRRLSVCKTLQEDGEIHLEKAVASAGSGWKEVRDLEVESWTLDLCAQIDPSDSDDCDIVSTADLGWREDSKPLVHLEDGRTRST